jgi:hypothetical protein
VSFTATAVASGAFTDDGFYIATHEPTDANTVLAEDFTRGAWYTKNCDDANASGGLGQTGVHGWCGNIFVEINPAGGVRNNFQGVGGKQYCGTSGNLGAVGMMADHSLKVASAEIWCRFYTKALAGYNWGAEKVLTINNGPAGVGGIWGGNIHVNCGTGGGTGQDGFMQWQGVGAPSCLGVLDVTAGNWYYVELHFNTAGRILQIWADNCGTNGLSPPAQPTLRLNQSGYAWMPSSGTVGSIWLEHWSNPGSSGERLWDYIKVQRGSRAGPIGFFTLA